MSSAINDRLVAALSGLVEADVATSSAGDPHRRRAAPQSDAYIALDSLLRYPLPICSDDDARARLIGFSDALISQLREAGPRSRSDRVHTNNADKAALQRPQDGVNGSAAQTGKRSRDASSHIVPADDLDIDDIMTALPLSRRMGDRAPLAALPLSQDVANAPNAGAKASGDAAPCSTSSVFATSAQSPSARRADVVSLLSSQSTPIDVTNLPTPSSPHIHASQPMRLHPIAENEQNDAASASNRVRSAAAALVVQYGSDGNDWRCARCRRVHVRSSDAAPWSVDSSGGVHDRAACTCPCARACPHAPTGTAPHRCALDAAAWEVVLLVDNREVRSRSDRGFLASQLAGKGIRVEVRQLPLGDFLWVVRRVAGSAPPACGCVPPATAAEASSKSRKKKREEDATPVQVEYVLDYIVERKAVSDLAASLIDGRYAEQKLRLAGTGMRVTYLIEGDPTAALDGRTSIGSKHILGAMLSTQVHYAFRLVNTYTMDATVAWLTRMHYAVESEFKRGMRCSAAPVATVDDDADILPTQPIVMSSHDDGLGMLLSQTTGQVAAISEGGVVWPVGPGRRRPPMSSTAHAPPHVHGPLCADDCCNLWGRPALPSHVRSYPDFAAAASKPRTLTSMHIFGRMLRQVHGCSADRAQGVIETFPTMPDLLDAYDSLAAPTRETAGMLRDMCVPNQRQTLGPALSATLGSLFGCVDAPAQEDDDDASSVPPVTTTASLPAFLRGKAADTVSSVRVPRADDKDDPIMSLSPPPAFLPRARSLDADDAAAASKPKRGGRGGWRGYRGSWASRR